MTCNNREEREGDVQTKRFVRGVIPDLRVDALEYSGSKRHVVQPPSVRLQDEPRVLIHEALILRGYQGSWCCHRGEQGTSVVVLTEVLVRCVKWFMITHQSHLWRRS
jgi:hypothetical protein